MFIFYFLLAAVLFYVFIKKRKALIEYNKTFAKFPISTKFRWITGTLHDFPGINEEGLEYLLERVKKNCYCHFEWYGPVTPVLFAYHPESVRPVFKSSAGKPRGYFLASTYDMGIRWLGEGLVLTNGDRWARNRRLLTPAFHFDILKPYLSIYQTCSDILIEKLTKLCKKGEPINIYPLINLDTLDVILRCAFSYESNCQIDRSNNNYSTLITDLQNLWTARSLTPVHFIDLFYKFSSDGKKFHKLCEAAHKFAEEVIEKRKRQLAKEVSNRKFKDFLDILLIARDEDGKGLSPLEIRNEVDTFMFEGHDTTASGMTFALYELAKHPEYQEKVYEEVVRVLDGREHLEWNDLPKLEVTTKCIKESLRLHPAVPYIERETVEDCSINGQILPKGTRIAIHIWLLHHNPHIWKNPDEFNPERFNPDNQVKLDPFQFVPFAAGQRNCIGQNFAMNEMKTTICKIIKK
ncbi:ultra-long-chain fatty acid omega-hydroxylase-like [Physella acuta]|uniref:ultra-long-chain fatty acid omega-hydroxylase-like n=1 Tax=Physella acuta TaxID=109671 RepID=UPI0027DDA3E3|nr:ultra-long-chain fatty acid omega-hydroxylase-like [Physella acuta]